MHKSFFMKNKQHNVFLVAYSDTQFSRNKYKVNDLKITYNAGSLGWTDTI